MLVFFSAQLHIYIYIEKIYIAYTHTHTHVGLYGLRGLSIGVMVLILYKAVCAIALHLTYT